MATANEILKRMEDNGITRAPFNEYLDKIKKINEDDNYDASLYAGSTSASLAASPAGPIETSQYDLSKVSSWDEEDGKLTTITIPEDSDRHKWIVQKYNEMISGAQKMYSIPKSVPITYDSTNDNCFSENMANKLVILAQAYVKKYPNEKLRLTDGWRTIDDGLNSPHNSGNAADVYGGSKEKCKFIADTAYMIGFAGIAIGLQGCYFVHVDVCKDIRWDYNNKSNYGKLQRYISPNEEWEKIK